MELQIQSRNIDMTPRWRMDIEKRSPRENREQGVRFRINS